MKDKLYAALEQAPSLEGKGWMCWVDCDTVLHDCDPVLHDCDPSTTFHSIFVLDAIFLIIIHSLFRKPVHVVVSIIQPHS